ncbi:MAG: pyridoxal-phosphate dependent enzyme, partial [Actinobacteria bacterium]|nr:pyridoxal-phosphate dependent enzyme [Actinomycetota bacterium]
MTVGRADVERAREVVAGRVHRTPMLRSTALGGVWLKAELFQKTGSFKARGALTCVSALGEEERRRGVVTWSAGNHAQAVAWASREAGVDCLVAMWQDANPLKVAATRGYGATVDTSSADASAAYELVQEIVERDGRVFVHPHSDPHVVAGHGTLALEILEDVPGLETIVVGVGGGGLISGIVAAVDGRVRVVGVEPERSPAFSAGLEAGRSVAVGMDTIAEGLAPPFAGDLPLELCHGRVETLLVSEDEIAEGMRFLYSRAKLACEPAGAAAAGAVLSGRVEGGPGVAVVVSGGNVVAREAAAILAQR